MKKRYKIEAGLDITITLEIDTDVMTAELAEEINEFWNGAKEILAASDGDVFQAVARRATYALVQGLMRGYSDDIVVPMLGNEEGWPGADAMGMEILDYDIPDLRASELNVTAISI